MIFSDYTIDDNTAGRKGCTFKDGAVVRRVVPRRDRSIEVRASEGNVEHVNRDLQAQQFDNFVVGSINAETSSFDGRLLLILDGFDAGTNNSRHVLIRTDYFIKPPTYYVS